jgi:hypothetical protein
MSEEYPNVSITIGFWCLIIAGVYFFYKERQEMLHKANIEADRKDKERQKMLHKANIEADRKDKEGREKLRQANIEADRKDDRMKAQLNKDMKEKEQLMKDVETVCGEYNKNVRRDGEESMKICRDWTNSECESANDLILFLEKYTRMKADVNAKRSVKTEPKDLKDFLQLEEFRRKGMDFWRKVVQKQYPLELFKMKFFLTFHWAIYMANNCCTNSVQGSEPKTYQWILNHSIVGKEDQKVIKEYRATLQIEFPRIQTENS